MYICDSPANQPTQPRVPPAHRSMEAHSQAPSFTSQVPALLQHPFQVGHRPGHRHRSSPGLTTTVMSRGLFSSHLMNPNKSVFSDYLLLLHCFLWFAFIAYLSINIPSLKVKSQRRCEWPCSTPGLPYKCLTHAVWLQQEPGSLSTPWMTLPHRTWPEELGAVHWSQMPSLSSEGSS